MIKGLKDYQRPRGCIQSCQSGKSFNHGSEYLRIKGLPTFYGMLYNHAHQENPLIMVQNIYGLKDYLHHTKQIL